MSYHCFYSVLFFFSIRLFNPAFNKENDRNNIQVESFNHADFPGYLKLWSLLTGFESLSFSYKKLSPRKVSDKIDQIPNVLVYIVNDIKDPNKQWKQVKTAPEVTLNKFRWIWKANQSKSIRTQEQR